MPKSQHEIFIVHGHNDLLKNEVARAIGQLGLRPIILHEQANGGRMIFEKLEEHAASASYAVILASADDLGRVDQAGSTLAPRARQNVVLELGYFAGWLGRKRVAVLCEPGVELPSDLLGLVYTPIDPHGGWKLALARELRNAEIPVDLAGLT